MGQKSIVIDRPVHAVFARVTDLERAGDWAPQMGSIHFDGGMREGAVFYEDRKILGRPAKAKWTITRYEPDRVFGVSLNFGPLRGRFAYLFDAVGSQTRLTQTTDIGLAGVLGIFSPLLAREVQKEEDTELVRLKEILERE
jgi:hypothetical protein